MTKVCCVFNIAPLYREAIYRLLDDSAALEVDFYAGDRSAGGIALMDATQLDGFRGYFRNRYRGKKLVWQKGWGRALGADYDAYVLTGNPGILSNWLLILCARLRGRRAWLWTHGLYGSESRFQRFKTMVYFRLAGRLLLYGQRGRDRVVEAGFRPERTMVIYNSLNYDEQVRLREKISSPLFLRNYFGNDDPTIVFLGRLTPEKSLDMFPEMLRRVNAVRPCNMVFIGGGAAERQLSESFDKEDLADRVWFVGECYDQQYIADFLYNSAAMVSPGNAGLNVMHAFAFGVPVVTHGDFTHQMPEAEAIVDGVTGSLFVRGDVGSLTEKVLWWIGRASDTPTREQTRRACYAVLEAHYTPQQQAAAIERSIADALLR